MCHIPLQLNKRKERATESPQEVTRNPEVFQVYDSMTLRKVFSNLQVSLD